MSVLSSIPHLKYRHFAGRKVRTYPVHIIVSNIFGIHGKLVWPAKPGERYPELLELLIDTLYEEGNVIRKVKVGYI